MTISPYAAGTYAGDLNARRLIGLKSQLDGLSTQLSTGKVAQTYGALGTARSTSLSAHAQVSALDASDAAIDLAKTRLDLAGASVQQAGKLASDTWSQFANPGTQTGGVARANLKAIAAGRLGGLVDALNQQTGNQYLFGGRTTGTAPVATADVILNGDAAAHRDGLGAVIAERRSADLGTGTPRTGRLSLARSGSAVTLAESQDPSVRANFGFTLAGATSSNPSAIAVTAVAGTAASASLAFASQPKEGDIVRVTVQNPDGSQGFVDLTARSGPAGGDGFAIGADAAASAANLSAALTGRQVAGVQVIGVQSAAPPGASAALGGGSPASVSVAVNAQPSPGDTVRVTVGLRDGTSKVIVLTAAAAGATAPGSFAIGATAADTAKNLSDALGSALDTAATTDLAASSAVRASSDFFAASASPGLAPRRVALDAAGNAAGYLADPSGRTVIWYRGDDTSADPRETAQVRISDNETVGIGVQANEAPLRDAMAGLAVAASLSFQEASSDDARYAAFSDRLKSLLSPDHGPTIKDISTDLTLASGRITAQKTQNGQTRLVLQNALAGVENADTQEVATKLLALQTQLQASYQTTATLAKLSLTNYL
ncbi:hypothetical protein [Methylobacterium sp. WSM2598]|uniref:hypothetical protein n=1 Tax=Methylobacterium sp. WSM2598 TaxID=398261 RepID=UPI0003609942|nr:hypothetical protein [Methylobacterium sp. WSM2598]